ncbi:MAG: MerR family transcriptional regulator [Magnetococcales bacterium]|nr:MerR family transcriptional regulator [Magnetococcales bacterium]
MWTIGRLASKFGLSRSTLLYYDKISLLSPTGGRNSANYRLYSDDDRTKLQRICSLREASLSLETIKKILESESDTLEVSLEERLGQLNDEIKQLRKHQKVIVQLLKMPEAQQGSRIIDKQKWITLLKSVGMDEIDMHNWHVSFEKMMPEAHQDFLESLGIEDKEIITIRELSQSTR